MSISGKIKALLSLKDKTAVGLAAHMDIEYQSLRNKLTKSRFSADELIRVAEFCDVDLAFITDGGDRIRLTPDDAKEIKRKQKTDNPAK